METEIAIINGCKKSDHRHQKMLYDQYRAFGLKIVFRYIYNYEEALEVTNDGFVKFFRSIDTFRWDGDTDIERLLRGWIKKIMINTSIDLLRKKMLLPEIGGIPDYAWDVPDTSETAEQVMIYNDLIKLVKRLPPVYRIVFNMHVIDGYSHMEIAEFLKIPVNTSKTNLARAKGLIQTYLNQKDDVKKCRI